MGGRVFFFLVVGMDEFVRGIRGGERDALVCGCVVVVWRLTGACAV